MYLYIDYNLIKIMYVYLIKIVWEFDKVNVNLLQKQIFGNF